LDLLARKVTMQGGAGLKALGAAMTASANRASAVTHLQTHAQQLQAAVKDIQHATQSAWAGGDPLTALPNAVPYMQAFGHVVLAWIWLDVALAAQQLPDQGVSNRGVNGFKQGKLAACDFFFNYELPKISAWLNVVSSHDMTCANMHADWF
jgi:butyryl-CoA dehydrogenase